MSDYVEQSGIVRTVLVRFAVDDRVVSTFPDPAIFAAQERLDS
ncbi:hypothetical protein [Curtobacterium sp. MCSS17_007]|nr:hypothetical protein [Curtobacterium sp. MCSS17_007]WIE76235.1 hypothetical protein DEJ22_002930 [Curtobacterium sp. MCSS17_007]